MILAAILLKMGTYGFLRFCLPLTPAASDYFAPLMIAISVASILYGGAVALGQSDIKKLVAYSSVGHMGFVTLGIFLFNQRGVEGALFQMLNHGVVTGGLFMMIGTVYERSHSREIGKNMGLGKYYAGLHVLLGPVLAGLVRLPGDQRLRRRDPGVRRRLPAQSLVGLLLVPGALLATAYLFRVGLKMAWGQPSAAKNWSDLSPREWVFLTVPAVMVFYIGLAPTLSSR